MNKLENQAKKLMERIRKMGRNYKGKFNVCEIKTSKSNY